MKYLCVAIVVAIVTSGCASQPSPPGAQTEGINLIQILTAQDPIKVDAAKEGQSLNLEQTIDGVTVTVQWVYADAEKALVGYTVRGAGGRRHDPRKTLLDTVDGESFISQGAIGVVGASDILDVELPPGQHTSVARFQMVENIDPGQPLEVRLTIETEEVIVPVAKEPGFWEKVTGFFGARQQPQDTRVQVQPLPPGRKTGPFTFDFSLPVK